MSIQPGKILLTGASGLVGARLLPRLLTAGLNCYVLVRGGKTVPSGALALEGDLFDQDSLIKAMEGVSAIIHLAAVFRTQDTALIWKSNLEGTQNLVAAAKAQAPNARFILASTSNVYNKDNPHPARENDTVNPEQAYPASKAAAEQVLRESGLNWSIVRFPFVYGEGDGHLEMLQKHAITAKWHPAMRMSTIHHRDIYTAVNMALQGLMDGRIVNISDEAPTSIYELVRLVGGMMPSSAEPLENPWYLHVDGSLVRSLGFRPVIKTVYQAATEGIL